MEKFLVLVSSHSFLLPPGARSNGLESRIALAWLSGGLQPPAGRKGIRWGDCCGLPNASTHPRPALKAPGYLTPPVQTG